MAATSIRIVRALCAQELAQVLELRGLVFEKEIGHTQVDLEQDHEPATRHFLAVQSGKALGCLSLVEQPLGEARAHRIRAVAVHPHVQLRGIGSTLLQEAVSIWQAQETTPVLWLSSLAGATGFYARHGFSAYEPPYLRLVEGWSQKMVCHRQP